MNDQEIDLLLREYGLGLTSVKIKPWGYTVGIQPSSIQKFVNIFFPKLNVSVDQLSPRFIVVNPNSRLSWQKHERRNELWKVLKGPVGVLVSQTDELPELPEVKDTGSVIEIGPRTRHRLVGLLVPAIIAEIWIHTDINHPSDASDIVRLDDDYER